MLEQVRERMLPMLRLVAEEYRPRVPEGYPIIVDSVANGVIGIEIDPSYALYITSDGKELFADYYCALVPNRRPLLGQSREVLRFSDVRPSPVLAVYHRPAIAKHDRRAHGRHNYQPGLIHISDS